jgi:hypothetical protein
MSINAVVMTCLESWVVDAINSVNNQDTPFDGKHLLVDERFLNDEGKVFLDSIQSSLDGWTVHVHPIDDNFAIHKNWMLDRLPKNEEWILWLDADEVINNKFVSTARSVIEFSDIHSENKVDACALAFVHSFEGREGELVLDWMNPGTFLYPDWHVRFFKNHKHTYFVNLVHEVLQGWKTVVPVGDPKMTILHRKTWEMQHASDKRWRRLDVLRRQADPSYKSELQGEEWIKYANYFEQLV